MSEKELSIEKQQEILKTAVATIAPKNCPDPTRPIRISIRIENGLIKCPGSELFGNSACINCDLNVDKNGGFPVNFFTNGTK